MFARVQTVHQPAEKLDALARVASEQLPGARELPGFQGFYYLVDHANGKAIVISMWETEDDLRQLPGHDEARQRVEAQSGVTSPPTEIFEVPLHVR